jgi:predicted nuclease of predicted toxin-antitoxin system
VISDVSAPDQEIISIARDHGFAIYTHDLDFGAILALIRSGGPSVIQLRDQAILPEIKVQR